MFRMVAIVEAYVDGVSRALFANALIGQSELFSSLVSSAESRAYDNWNERKKVFTEHHRIPLSECANWQAIDAAIEIRNAVAHGLGRLTARQRNSATIGKLSQIAISVVDDRPIVDISGITQCYHYCREFISSLDRKASMRIWQG